jgi:MFS family permease
MRRGTTRVLRSTLVAGALAEIVLLAVLTLAQGLATAALSLAASAAAGSLYQVWGSTELQLRAPAEVLGRAGAALVLAQYVGMLLGAILAAALVPLVGWDRALFAACCAALAAIAASVTGPLRQAAPRPVV